jgi:LysM repeat protein
MFCQIRSAVHHPAMKSVIWLPSSCALILILTGCANNKTASANDPGYGPFDRNGTYREDWADDPSKWRKPGKQTSPADEVPVIAKNEEPPPNANPLSPKTTVAQKNTPAPVRVESTPRETTRKESAPRETARQTKAPVEVAAKPKPKPKTTVVKVKPKPKTQRYIVKQGDSLSTIASRNGSSVAAIRSANDISGTLIHPGQSLVIPKRQR